MKLEYKLLDHVRKLGGRASLFCVAFGNLISEKETYEEKRKIRVSDLKEEIQLDSRTKNYIHTFARAAERREMIHRTLSAEDNRVWYVQFTKKGKEWYDEYVELKSNF